MQHTCERERDGTPMQARLLLTSEDVPRRQAHPSRLTSHLKPESQGRSGVKQRISKAIARELAPPLH